MLRYGSRKVNNLNMEKQFTESDCDKISELPQPILHHILSFLSLKEAVRTYVLSKTWRQVWCTRPKIKFDEGRYFVSKPGTFLSVFDKSLQESRDQNLPIEEFKVNFRSRSCFSLLDRWIPIVILNMRPKKFSLHCEYDCLPLYGLPPIVFESKFLQELLLGECNVAPLEKVLCKNLTTLELSGVGIVDETFQSIISCCPLIEAITLECCTGLGNIKMHEKKLHNLKDFRYSGSTKNTEFHLPTTLETIKIISDCGWLVVNKFTNLKSLDLRRVRLSSEWLHNFSCNFPILESLNLHNCYGCEELLLSSQSIKQLTVWMNEKESVKVVNIDAPNLISFEYGFFVPQSITFTIKASTKKWKSKFHIGLDVVVADDVDNWFLKLKEVLMSLSQSEIYLDISVYGPFNLILVDSGSDGAGDSYKPLLVEHLILPCAYRDPTSSLQSYFLNGFFRICRPKFIGGFHWSPSGWGREINESVQSLLRNIPQSYPDLEEVGIEVKNGEGEWCPVYGTSLSECAFPSNEDKSFRFRLKWSEVSF